MSNVVISAQGLAKRYLIGHERGRDGHTFREALAGTARNAFRKAADMIHGRPIVQGDDVEEVWALRDVSFDVGRGEVLGIIGRNGAGKSTLLKILSRITEPTHGQLTIEGRVASLLEVGTGFHPELTGRENIYLNGAILGMARSEIRRKFDEIVDFAEVEKFLDTPVKRYSSGMYVRLAFAVAAHLEPEILIVDEVLAVGDASFQKKCLGKIQNVASQEGRTVLFVSHNMEAVLKLCTRCLLVSSGRIVSDGNVGPVVSQYLEGHLSSGTVVDLREKYRPFGGEGRARLVSATPEEGRNGWSLRFGERFIVNFEIEALEPMANIELGIGLFSARGFEVLSWTNKSGRTTLPLSQGRNSVRIEYEDAMLLPGQYLLGIGLRSDRGFEDYIADAVHFEIVVSDQSAEIDAHTFGGVLVPKVNARSVPLRPALVRP